MSSRGLFLLNIGKYYVFFTPGNSLEAHVLKVGIGLRSKIGIGSPSPTVCRTSFRRTYPRDSAPFSPSICKHFTGSRWLQCLLCKAIRGGFHHSSPGVGGGDELRFRVSCIQECIYCDLNHAASPRVFSRIHTFKAVVSNLFYSAHPL